MGAVLDAGGRLEEDEKADQRVVSGHVLRV
jgi:hypothetical protein